MTIKKKKPTAVDLKKADVPTVLLTLADYEARVASAVRSALDELEVFFCLEDQSHYPHTSEAAFLAMHGEHRFVRFHASDLIDNPHEKKNLMVDAELREGDYDVVLSVDGEKIIQSEHTWVNKLIQVRALPLKDFPDAPRT